MIPTFSTDNLPYSTGGYCSTNDNILEQTKEVKHKGS